MFFLTSMQVIVPTVWLFLASPAGIVFMIIVTILIFAFWETIKTNRACQVGCGGCFIVFVAIIVMGVSGISKLMQQSMNENSSSTTVNGSNDFNSNLDLNDLHKLINEVNSGDDSSLSNYTKADLRILRNMVFAEKGFRIQKAGLKEYFEQKSWYNPYIDNQNDISLNIKEKRFLEAVQKYEEN